MLYFLFHRREGVSVFDVVTVLVAAAAVPVMWVLTTVILIIMLFTGRKVHTEDLIEWSLWTFACAVELGIIYVFVR